MFNANDILELRNFTQVIIGKPRAMEVQPHKREGVFLWCEDWEMIEILKYLFNGAEVYKEDPPPNRLKFNPLWSKEGIAKKAEDLIAKYKTVPAIIEHLKGIRNAA